MKAHDTGILIGMTLVSVLGLVQARAGVERRPAADVNDAWRLAVQAWSFKEFTFYEAIEKTSALGLDWIEAGKNPQGTPNKFKYAYKDMPRVGFIGFQDHGSAVAFRNLRIKKL